MLMKKVKSLCMLSLFLLLPQSFTPSDAQAERIRRVETGLTTFNIIKNNPTRFDLNDRMLHYKVPGVSIAVIDGGKIAWTRAYGVVESGSTKKVDVETLFQAGSISKPVTALGALRLVQKGRLLLDTNVNQYLKSWTVPENEYTVHRKVTTRDILSHRAGLNMPSFRGYAKGEAVPSVTKILDGQPPANTPAVRVVRAPGSRPFYSGGGYVVLQLLMEDLEGISFPTIIKREVFDPIGMTSSTFEQPLPDGFASRAATGHTNTGEPLPDKWLTFPEMAAAGLWSKPSDLARLIINVRKSIEGANGILKQALAQEMLTQLSGDQGLGFAVDGDYFGHDGSNKGFQASMVAFKKRGQGAVIMTNSHNGLALAAEILRSLALEYDWPAFRPRERELAQVAPEIYKDFVGTYRSNSSGETAQVTILLEKNIPRAESSYWKGSRILYPLSEKRFFTLEGDWEMEFIREERKVTGIQFGPVRMQRLD